MAPVDVGEHLAIDPAIMHGRLTFRGTRIPVSTVLSSLAGGRSVDEVVADWPQVRPEAVREAIMLASEALHARYRGEIDAAGCEARRLRDRQRDAAAIL